MYFSVYLLVELDLLLQKYLVGGLDVFHSLLVECVHLHIQIDLFLWTNPHLCQKRVADSIASLPDTDSSCCVFTFHLLSLPLGPLTKETSTFNIH